MARQMRLVGWISTGASHYHPGTWRHPSTELPSSDIQATVRLTQTLEHAKFDAVFFADGIGGAARGHERVGLNGIVDPLPLAAALTQATSHIGVGVTTNSQYHSPYMLARLLGSVDYISGGRLAWNVVTGMNERAAQMLDNEGVQGRDERYTAAAEVVEACKLLWSSFPPEAIVADRESGQFLNTDLINEFEYSGEYVKTVGPLDVPTSPQGHPIIMQAGSSESGRDFAAKYAEAIFVMVYLPEDIKEFIDDIRARMEKIGRPQNELVVLPLITVVSAPTEELAQASWKHVNDLNDIEAALKIASGVMGVDLSQYDHTLPAVEVLGSPEIVNQASGSVGLRDLTLQIAKRDNLTLGEAAAKMASSGVPEMIGTPEQIADQMEELFTYTGADGFMIHAPIMPAAFEDIARQVVPVLQKRGLFRTKYEHSTLRGHLFGE